MNKEKLIELGLSEEQAQKVLDGFGKMVPIDRLNEKIEEVKQANAVIAERDKQIKDLEPLAAGNEGLLNQIKELQSTNEATKAEYEQKLFDNKVDTAMKMKLNGKVHDLPTYLSFFDKSLIKLDDDGEIIGGFDEQHTSISEQKSYFLIPEQVGAPTVPTPSFTPGSPTPPANGSTDPFAAKMAKYE